MNCIVWLWRNWLLVIIVKEIHNNDDMRTLRKDRK